MKRYILFGRCKDRMKRNSNIYPKRIYAFATAMSFFRLTYWDYSFHTEKELKEKQTPKIEKNKEIIEKWK